MRKAIVLLSGGLDSTTCLAFARMQGFECYALSFRYGQKHEAELAVAQKIAEQYGVLKHDIVDLSLSCFMRSALTNTEIAIPHHEDSEKIPQTYVPARNTIMLSIALGLAELTEADAIFIGVSSVDYSNYPDCRPEYIQAFTDMANLATKSAVVDKKIISIETPLLYLSKSETVQLGLSLGVDYANTVSCYQASDEGLACGVCPSCFLRQKGFKDAGVSDPTRYAS